ncbi:MAG: nucleoid-associated protein [Sarcina sp.]
MEYVNDINIIEAVIHILDNNSEEPILNEYKLDLTDDVYKFLYKHIDRALKDEELKYAVFNPEGGLVKEVSQEYLNGETRDIVGVSQELATQMFYVMKGNLSIPSCDLIIVTISTDQGPMLGILKMDYVKNFTHKVDFVDDRIGIGIVEQAAGLPTAQKIQKAAFIKPIRDGQEVNLMVIDKSKKSDDELTSNYFVQNYLGCTLIQNERDKTKAFVKAAETWTRNNVFEDAEKAEEIRTAIKTKLKEDNINLQELSQELFKEEPQVQDNFKGFIMGHGLEEEVAIDRQWVDKKLKRVRLKIDKQIDLYIDEEAYNDSGKFEIVRNGDGTINMVIKFVNNYIEK